MQIPKIYNSREISPIIRSISLFCLALLVITATTAIVWLVFTSLITVPTSDDVAALHDVRAWPKPWAGIKPEPVENITFIFVLILSVICIGLAAYLSTSDLGKRLLLKVSPFIDLSVIAITSAAIVLWFWWMDWTSLVPPSPSGLLIAIRMYPLGFAGSIFFLVTLFLIMYRLLPFLKWRYLALISATLPLAYLSRLVISSTQDYSTVYWHYQLVVHPIIQTWLGRAIYINQESLYGFYPVFLHPLWLILGPPTTTMVTVVMASLLFFANMAFAGFMFRFNHYKGLAVTFALLAIIFALQFYPFWPGDSYFQFFPLRVLFPALALMFMCFRVTSTRYPFIAYLVLSFGVFWNFESGMIALISFGVFGVFSRYSPQWLPFRRLLLKHVGMALIGLIVAFLTINAYYLLQFGAMPDWGGLTKYIRVYSAGYYSEPMPMWGAWIIPVVIYLGGLFVGLRSLFTPQSQDRRERYAALLAISIMGMLFFKYYQNRSVPLQLLFSTFPTFLVMGFLVDIWLPKLQRFTTRTAQILTVLIATPLMSALFIFSVSDPVPNRDWSSIRGDNRPTALDVTADAVKNIFSQVRQRDSDEILVIAPYAGLVQLKLEKPHLLASPHVCAFEFKSERASIVAVLRKETTRMAVFDFNPLCRQGGEVDKEEVSIALALQEKFQPLSTLANSCSILGPNFRAFVRRDLANTVSVSHRDQGTNLAIGKLATQSSEFGLLGASVAVDGNTDGRWAESSTTHSSLQFQPWWQVDLGSTAAVNTVEVWNRVDSFSERLSGYWVFTSENPFLPGDTPEMLRTRTDVSSSYQEYAPCPKTTLNVGKPARYIRVQLQGEGYLSLAEVRVLRR